VERKKEENGVLVERYRLFVPFFFTHTRVEFLCIHGDIFSLNHPFFSGKARKENTFSREHGFVIRRKLEMYVVFEKVFLF